MQPADPTCLAIVRAALAVVRPQFRLDFHHGIHGVAHWSRVWLHGRTLAKALDVDPRIIAWFAFLHDSQRVDDGIDEGHGARGGLRCAAAARRRDDRSRCFGLRATVRGDAAPQRRADGERACDPRVLRRRPTRPRPRRHAAAPALHLHRPRPPRGHHRPRHVADRRSAREPAAATEFARTVNLALGAPLGPRSLRLLPSRILVTRLAGALARAAVLFALGCPSPSQSPATPPSSLSVANAAMPFGARPSRPRCTSRRSRAASPVWIASRVAVTNTPARRRRRGRC